MAISPLVLLALAAVSNIASMIFLKLCKGFTQPWPSLGCVVFIIVTQWLIGAALARGGQLGLAVTGVVVATMIGAAITGPVLGDPKPGVWQFLGYGLAIIGVTLASAMK
jgi:multidrug transporter EmrE-like cation transporter